MFTNYGLFQPYVPQWPEQFPADSTYRRFKYYRNSDGHDYYVMTHPEMEDGLREILGPAPTIASDATYFCARPKGEGAWVVQVASNDPSETSPPNMVFCAVDRLDDPRSIVGKAVDLTTGAISEPPLPPVVAVTPAQARLALHRAGLLSQVQALAAADPEIAIWFDHALAWERTNPYVARLAQQLDPPLTEAQIDELFRVAATL